MRPLDVTLERGIFHARWLLAPAYLALLGCLAVLSLDTILGFVQLVAILTGRIADPHGGLFNETKVILQVLNLVDLILLLNLVLMVLYVGYVDFVARRRPADIVDWPAWTLTVGQGGLKLQLMGAIAAIASVKLLHEFVALVDYDEVEPRKLLWMAVLYAALLAGMLVLAAVDRLAHAK